MSGPARRRAADLVAAVDRLNETVGRALAWVVLAMVAVTCLVAVLRYGFSLGWAWLQESYVWMHGAAFMLGAGYTLRHDAHVRVDVFYRPAGPRYRALVDLAGALLLVLPLTAVLAWFGFPYVAASWATLERSGEAGGLPGLFALKSLLLAFCVLVALQALALAGRSVLTLTADADTPGE